MPIDLFTRYREGYQVCRWLIVAGQLIAFFGFCLMVAFYYCVYKSLPTLDKLTPPVTSWITKTFQVPADEQAFYFFAVVICIGLAMLLIFGVIGKIINGFGQTVRAVIDTAVNTSPLLDLDEKSEVMEHPWVRIFLKIGKFFRRD